MKYATIFFAFIYFLVGCNEIESGKKASEVSQEINETNQLIEENIKKADGHNYDRKRIENLDGPYSADQYSIKPTGKFYMLAVYPQEKDSVWLTFSSKTDGEILKKYSKLKVFKVRPSSITRDNWLKIRQDCIKENMIFDISDEPKGWLLENEKYLK